jgi:hypothetical protein
LPKKFAAYDLANLHGKGKMSESEWLGGFVVREAFRSIDKGRDAQLSNDWRLGQVVFFAADVSSSCFDA